MESREKKDKWNLVFISFILFGIVSLLPTNTFFNAQGYFTYKLRNTSFSEDDDYANPNYATSLQHQYESIVSVCAMIPSLIGVILNLIFQKRFSFYVRFYFGISLLILNFAVTIMLIWIDVDHFQEGFFAITMIMVATMSFGGCFVCSSLFGMGSFFPLKYIRALCEGLALSGIATSVSSIIALALGLNARATATFYFCVSFGLVTVGLIVYYFVLRTEFFRSVLKPKNRNAVTINEDLVDTNSLVSAIPPKSLFQVFVSIWPLGVSIFAIFLATLSVFPAISANIHSLNRQVDDPWSQKFFTPVTCFLLFNFGDWLGRFLAGLIRLPTHRYPLVIVALSLSRFLFLPALMVCNVSPRGELSVFSLLFDHDAAPMLLNLTLGLSNGYLCCLCLMFAPLLCPRGCEETAGNIMMVCMNFGLSGGTLLSLLLIRIV